VRPPAFHCQSDVLFSLSVRGLQTSAHAVPIDITQDSVENGDSSDHTTSDDFGPNPFTIPRASDIELNHWQSEVFVETDGEGLDVEGPTAEAVAEALLSLLESHQSSIPFVSPEGVFCAATPLVSFIQRWHHIRM
jgi:hypothetical protein